MGNRLIRQSELEISKRSRFSSEPKYSIHEDPDTGMIEVSVEVPGIPANDLFVSVEDDKILSIEGTRTNRHHGGVSSSTDDGSETTEFSISFRLNENTDVDRMKVSLSDGILVIYMPRKIPVVRRLQIDTSNKGLNHL